jgi:hypothetical protein
MTTKNCNDVPEAERLQLLALAQRYRQLVVQLPTDPDELANLDPTDFAAALDNIELISAELQTINAAQHAILEELEEA